MIKRSALAACVRTLRAGRSLKVYRPTQKKTKRERKAAQEKREGKNERMLRHAYVSECVSPVSPDSARSSLMEDR
jgi:hypothetical protein